MFPCRAKAEILGHVTCSSLRLCIPLVTSFCAFYLQKLLNLSLSLPSVGFEVWPRPLLPTEPQSWGSENAIGNAAIATIRPSAVQGRGASVCTFYAHFERSGPLQCKQPYPCDDCGSLIGCQEMRIYLPPLLCPLSLSRFFGEDLKVTGSSGSLIYLHSNYLLCK